MRLLITRPQERAAPLKDRLEELGFEVSLAPLLTISNLDFEIPENPLQGVIFTSVQGVEAVKDKEGLKFFPAFTVGSKTAGAAAAAGFSNVHNADGNVEDLLELVLTTCNPGKGLLLHLAGENTVGNLAARLAEKGYEAKAETVYRAVAAQSLPSNIIEKINLRQVEAVLFFSTRTAAIFKSIAEDKNLLGLLEKMEAFCLSENIAAEAAKLAWKKVHCSEQPTEQSLIELLQTKGK